ncbi:MAG: hypothetical protein Kow009_03630 [Spirochaetales bacterium]
MYRYGMEEIKTSEKLEQEILEDARRKAERILKGAEKTIAGIEAEWREKEEAFRNSSRQELEEKKKRIQQEISASIPLELKRMELRILDEKFESFLQRFFEELPEEEFASLIQKHLIEARSFLEGIPVSLSYNEVDQAESLVRSVIPGIRIVSTREGTHPRGVWIQSEDGSLRFRLTMDELKEDVRQKFRREVFDALFPGMKE